MQKRRLESRNLAHPLLDPGTAQTFRAADSALREKYQTIRDTEHDGISNRRIGSETDERPTFFYKGVKEVRCMQRGR